MKQRLKEYTNTASGCLPWRTLLLGVVALAITTSGVAQDTGVLQTQERREAISAALDAFRIGEVATGEALLKGALLSAPETAGWALEFGDLLLAQSFALRTEEKFDTAAVLAGKARLQLEVAGEKFSASPTQDPAADKKRAAVLYLLGVYWESVVGDREKAKHSYQQALSLRPEHQSARESLAWLEALDKERNRKLGR